MKKEMLINVSQPEECRIAIIEDGVLEELYIERASQDNFVGNIYKGRIVNLEPSIQAAFVDFGVGRNGFLHISDVEPQYFRQGGYDPRKAIGANGGGGPAGPREVEFDRLEEDEGHSHGGGQGQGGGRGRSGGRNGGGGAKTARYRMGVRPRFKPPIQDIFQRGDEVLVQVIKEG